MENVKKKSMMDFIEKTPEKLSENIENSFALTKELVDAYIKGGYKNIWIVASGSSANSAYCARDFMRHHLNCDVKILSPFTFIYAENNFSDTDFVFVISQSGYSTNSIAALKKIKERGRNVIGLTGDLESDFKNYCDLLIDFGVGEETVGYVTLGVSTLSLFLMLFSLEAGKLQGADDYEKTIAELKKVPAIHKMVQKEFLSFYNENYKALTSMTNTYVCSVGANLGTAKEGALKIGETVLIPTADYDAEEYIHGPNLQLTPNYTVFIIDGGMASDRLKSIFDATRVVTDRAYFITCNKKYEGNGIFFLDFSVDEDITPLCYLPIFQMLSYLATNDLSRWNKHPLESKMEKLAASKSENYKNSPLERYK